MQIYCTFVVEILLKATGDAPIMEKRKWKLERTKTIGGVASFIKKYIKVDQNDSLVNPWLIYIADNTSAVIHALIEIDRCAVLIGSRLIL